LFVASLVIGFISDGLMQIHITDNFDGGFRMNNGTICGNDMFDCWPKHYANTYNYSVISLYFCGVGFGLLGLVCYAYSAFQAGMRIYIVSAVCSLFAFLIMIFNECWFKFDYYYDMTNVTWKDRCFHTYNLYGFYFCIANAIAAVCAASVCLESMDDGPDLEELKKLIDTTTKDKADPEDPEEPPKEIPVDIDINTNTDEGTTTITTTTTTIITAPASTPPKKEESPGKAAPKKKHHPASQH